MKKLSLIVLIALSVVLIGAQAQDEDLYTGIVDICGEDVLAIQSADALPEDETTLTLDNLLQQFVTFPAEGTPPLQQGVPAPAAVIMLDTPDGRYFRSIGAGDFETCGPVDPSTPFPIGSNTKMFTAAVIYQLQEEGLLSTDDLVSQYLPEEIGLWEGAETITIDMLLSHTSGLPDYLNSQSSPSIGKRIENGEPGLLETAFTPRELIENSAEADPLLLFPPGAGGQWSYSNTGYIMLGLIIEQVTGQSYAEAVTERIIQPLELEHTVVLEGVAPDDLGLVGQYLIDRMTLEVVEVSGWHSSQAWSAGSIVSTAEDMVVFLRALYSGELFQDSATLDAMLTRAAPGYANETDDFYYMHGGFYKAGFLGHGGQTLGTESDVGYHPDYDIVVVTWSNTAYAYTGQGIFHIGNALGITPSWSDVVAEITGISSMPPPPTTTLEDLTGVTFSLNGMYINSTEESVQIEPSPDYTIQFDEDGQMQIQADCNMLTATYTTGDEDALTIDLGISTMAACPEGSYSDTMLNLLQDVDNIRILAGEEEIVIFLRTPDQSFLSFTASR